MKKSIRIVSLALVLVMVIALLAACGGKKPPVDTQKPSITPGGNTPSVNEKWKDVKFDDEKIIISMSDWVPMPVEKAGSTNGIKYIQGPDAQTTDAVQNAVYNRNKKVTTALGIVPEYQHYTYDGGPNDTLVVLTNWVLANLESCPDIVSTMSYGMVRAGITGVLLNALTTKEENNYLDLKKEYGWYDDFMFENTLDENKVFMLAGDYFIDVLRYTNGAFVNIGMYNDLFATEGGIESLYATINDGNWTYDELIRCADKAYVDRGTTGVKDESDTFGIVINNSWFVRNCFSTSGLDLFEEKDGKISYIEDITDVHNFVDALIEIDSSKGFAGPQDFSHEGIDIFKVGQSLFALDQPLLSLEGTYVRNMDQKVGIIPYPKYDADEPYRALVQDSGNSGGILYNTDKFVPVSAFLQMMTEESNTGKGSLIYEYYEITLKYKYAADSNQVKMLEIIRGGICSPKSMLYDNYFAQAAGMKQYRELMQPSIDAGENNFASDWKTQYSAVQQALEDTYVNYGPQN